MEAPLFSQIPNVVLNKIKKPTRPKKRKFVKFYDDPTIGGSQSDDVTSSWSEADPIRKGSPDEFVEQTRLEEEHKIEKKLKPSVSFAEETTGDIAIHCPTCACNKQKADAITRTDVVEVESQKTQTEEGFPAADPQDSYKKELEAQSLKGQMYSIPNATNAPLKLGLTLKGKKRIVYYPDEVYARQD